MTFGKAHVATIAVVTAASALSANGLLDDDAWHKVANEGQVLTVPSVDEMPTDHRVGLAVNQVSIDAANAEAPPGIDHELFRTGAPIPRSAFEDGPIDYTIVGAPPKGNWSQWGDFRTLCNYTHYGYNDPIVMPGKKNASHLHIFFGNTAVDESTTSENIRTRNKPRASCRGGTMNLTGYWTPAVLDRDTRNIVRPANILIYYKTAGWVYMDGNPPIEDLPHGLKMVVGNAMGSVPQPLSTSSFACMSPVNGGRTNLQNQNYDHFPTTCKPGDQVWWAVHFKQCWNGELDSADHKSHLADFVRAPNPRWNGRGRTCPATHPFVIVQVAQILYYDVTTGPGGDPVRWALASDIYLNDNSLMPAGYSAHADWMNGWDPVWSDRWSQKCSRERRDCGSWTDGDGRQARSFQGN